MQGTRQIKAELYCDNFQNYKRYNIPKAQLVIADIPYNLGANAYASNPEWYIGGDNKKGESAKAGKSFFRTDSNFNIAEYFHFCNRLLIKEPKEKGKAPAMIVFCAFEQIPIVLQYAEKHGFKHHNFGRDRLKALADEVNANIKEFYADPEAGCYNIKRAMEQIGFDDNIGDIMDTLAVHDDLKAKLSRIKK